MSGSSLFSIGEAYVEMLPSGSSPEDVPSFRPRAGGAAARVCAAFARLGGRSVFLGQLGDDPFGHQLAGQLAACGVDVSRMVFTAAASTALVFADPQTGAPAVYGKPSAGLLYAPEQLDPHWLQEAFALHFGSSSLVDSPLRYAHLAAITAARDAGALVSFAPRLCAARWADRETLRQTVLQFAPLAHILTLTDAEAELLTGSTDPDAALPQLLAGDVQLVLYLTGRDVLACTRTARAAAHRPDTADTAAFPASFLWQLARDGITADKLARLSRSRLHEYLHVVPAPQT